MVELELFAGDNSLLFEIRKEQANWTIVYAKTKEGILRLGAESFKILRKNFMLNLPPPYSPNKTVDSEIENHIFTVSNLMDTLASIFGEPNDDNTLKLLWNSYTHRELTHLMTLTPEDVQSWIHTLEIFELD